MLRPATTYMYFYQCLPMHNAFLGDQLILHICEPHARKQSVSRFLLPGFTVGSCLNLQTIAVQLCSVQAACRTEGAGPAYPSPRGWELQELRDCASGICEGLGRCRTAACCLRGEASHCRVQRIKDRFSYYFAFL